MPRRNHTKRAKSSAPKLRFARYWESSFDEQPVVVRILSSKAGMVEFKHPDGYTAWTTKEQIARAA